MAQRLVRRICADCKTAHMPEESEFPPDFVRSSLFVDRGGGADEPRTTNHEQLYRGAGCRECRGTGYRGRVGIYELLTMTEPIKEMVLARLNASRIAQAAAEAGDLTLLRQAGFDKVRAGETTFAEVVRATKA